jgi:hypothetical protein
MENRSSSLIVIARIGTFLVVCGIALLLHGWWGICTRSGQRVYPEMAGLLPFYGGGVGVILLLLAAVLYGVRWYKTRRSSAGA